MSGRVAGKRIAVIGAGSAGPGWGNGKAAAVLYAREGGHVLCVDRNEAAAAETQRLIENDGGRAAVHVGDMTEPSSAAGAILAAHRALGGLDILHYNIGTSVRGGIRTTDIDAWQRTFAINLDAAFHLTRAALPLLEDGGGSIVYVSTLAAIRNGPYPYIGYEVSKAALCRLSSSVAIEYATRGVRANTVLPGMIDTPHVAAVIAPDQDPERVRAARAAQVPMKRQGSGWEVAEAALFLASDAASFITGVDLRVDGGMGVLMGNAAG